MKAKEKAQRDAALVAAMTITAAGLSHMAEGGILSPVIKKEAVRLSDMLALDLEMLQSKIEMSPFEDLGLR